MDIDPDQHREIVFAAVRLIHSSITQSIRKSARVAARCPGLTAERALDDVADVLERQLLEIDMMGTISTKH